jgi:hypothetical protein
MVTFLFPVLIEIPHYKYSYHYINNQSKSFPDMVRRLYFWNNSLSRPVDISIDQLYYAQSGFRYFDLLQPLYSILP